MAESKDISRQDSKLFRQTLGDVDAVKLDEIHLAIPKPLPVPNQSQSNDQNIPNQMTADHLDIPDIGIGDELYFKKSCVQKQTIRKLRRGKFSIQSELDLHGMTVDIAKKELHDFLAYCQTTNHRYVRMIHGKTCHTPNIIHGKTCHVIKIIHGKGHRSANKIPILKNKLNQWLQKYDSILAFCSAPFHDGGTGAVYVLMKITKKIY